MEPATQWQPHIGFSPRPSPAPWIRDDYSSSQRYPTRHSHSGQQEEQQQPSQPSSAPTAKHAPPQGTSALDAFAPAWHNPQPPARDEKGRDANRQSHPRSQSPPWPSRDTDASQPAIVRRHHQQHQHQRQHRVADASNMPPLTATVKCQSPPFGGGDHQPSQQQQQKQPLVLSPRPTAAASWRGTPTDGYSAEPDIRRLECGPLTIHIPNPVEHHHNRDLPHHSPGSLLLPQDGMHISAGQSVRTPAPTSLPSFAHFRESAARSEGSDEVEIAPMSSRLSCSICAKLKPMVSEVAYRVAELDENIQLQCSKSVTRALDFPQDNSVRIAEWIINRLAMAKVDLAEASQRQRLSQRHLSVSTEPVRGVQSSHFNGLKRPADQWDHGAMLKRPRATNESPEPLPRTAIGSSLREDYDPLSRPGFSPPFSENAPESTYARTVSPIYGRSARALPSPSSVAYPSSAAPSLAAPNGSPTTLYNSGPALHSMPTHPATSAHIADLQHQVTVKSLALESLQAEHVSLLQRVQRERMRSQVIERKTTVADREVNELTGRNEELTEQIKALRKQLEDSEKKRDDVHAEAKREKEQWSRMLDMSSRLQNKHAEDKQKLSEENARLSARLAAVEELEKSLEAHSATLPQVACKVAAYGVEAADLKRQNSLLKTRLDAVRNVLSGSKVYHEEVLQRMQREHARLFAALNDKSELMQVDDLAISSTTAQIPAGATATISPNSHLPLNQITGSPFDSRPLHMPDSLAMTSTNRVAATTPSPEASNSAASPRVSAADHADMPPRRAQSVSEERKPSFSAILNGSPPLSASHAGIVPRSTRDSPASSFHSSPIPTKERTPESNQAATGAAQTSRGDLQNSASKNVRPSFNSQSAYIPRAYGEHTHHAPPLESSRNTWNVVAMPPPPRPV